MFDDLPVVAAVFTLVAAALHVLFFVLESLLFGRPFAWRTFGVRSEQDAATVRDWALNQGYYNLFLAVGAVVGVLLTTSTDPVLVGAGIGMVLLATGSMLVSRGCPAGVQTVAATGRSHPGPPTAGGHCVDAGVRSVVMIG